METEAPRLGCIGHRVLLEVKDHLSKGPGSSLLERAGKKVVLLREIIPN